MTHTLCNSSMFRVGDCVDSCIYKAVGPPPPASLQPVASSLTAQQGPEERRSFASLVVSSGPILGVKFQSQGPRLHELDMEAVDTPNAVKGRTLCRKRAFSPGITWVLSPGRKHVACNPDPAPCFLSNRRNLRGSRAPEFLQNMGCLYSPVIMRLS